MTLIRRPLGTICHCFQLRWGGSSTTLSEAERQPERFYISDKVTSQSLIMPISFMIFSLRLTAWWMWPYTSTSGWRNAAGFRSSLSCNVTTSASRAHVSCSPGPSKPVFLMLSGNHHEKYFFYLIDSPQNPLVLRYPWLVKHNPHLKWAETTNLGWSPVSLHYACSARPVQGTQGLSRPMDCSWRVPRSEASLQHI